ncbi:MAG TPA: histidine kinase dimerization/phosphoacceptor domain -containing protein [Frateuria sp.]|uniref:sensor histidine kinase n=1 Tax=Frateuria sp. TaxID=2211372 RepID=UPI002DF40FB0|nr:histidine kinase dimerization/phosphoacceptor domain -containing protein [Frateuria sp.]
MRQHIEAGCASKAFPLLEPAAIQPHGALLAADAAGFIASLAGATGKVFGCAPHDLLGRPVAAISSPAGTMLAAPPELAGYARHVGTWLARDHNRWDVCAHRSGLYTMLEFEPAPVEETHAAVAIADIQQACAAFESCADVPAACVACAKAIRRLTGFHRVTVARFAAGATVVAAAMEEAASSSLPSLGDVLPFAPDREVQAHAVPDLAYLPAPVLHAGTEEGGPHLGHCLLRGIGAAQRVRLGSLGVASSLWLPINVRGRPWGMVACHHADTRAIPCAQRLACEQVVRECVLRIEACESDERLRQADARQQALHGHAGLLVQEANHRVQNSLHIAASMLQLQARHAGQAVVRSELQTAAARVAAVGAVHRQLSRPGDPHDVPLDVYLGQLCVDLARSWGDAWMEQLTVDACPVTLAADSAVSLGLVVTELLINAAKYAYRGSPGPISVHAAIQGTWLHVAVSDRGCGIHGEILGTGLGSRLNRLFAAQLGGDIQLSSGDTGTTVTVRVPLPQPLQEGAAGATVEAGAD